MQLNEYLKKKGISMCEAAKALGTDYENVRRYCAGTVVPRRKMIEAIRTWTNNAVRADDFFTKQED